MSHAEKKGGTVAAVLNNSPIRGSRLLVCWLQTASMTGPGGFDDVLALGSVFASSLACTKIAASIEESATDADLKDVAPHFAKLHPTTAPVPERSPSRGQATAHAATRRS
jgi:hypothetical protein